MPTSISWTNETWNPVTGCNKISPGCKNCYAEAIAERFWAKQYPPNTDGSPREFTDVRCHQDRVQAPFSWRTPRMVFVNSMSDLFHDAVPFDFIDQVFCVMTGAKEHTFQILTKRPERMALIMPELLKRATGGRPLPNVWLGVSVENQKAADERIPHLLNTPAAVRWISAEPLLESIELREENPDVGEFSYLRGFQGCDPPIPRLDWVVCGGESGPGARPFDLAWAEWLLAQCQAAHVPFFMKQCGSVPMIRENAWRERINTTGLAGLLKASNATKVPYDCVPLYMRDSKGEDPGEWPERLRVREWPKSADVEEEACPTSAA